MIHKYSYIWVCRLQFFQYNAVFREHTLFLLQDHKTCYKIHLIGMHEQFPFITITLIGFVVTKRSKNLFDYLKLNGWHCCGLLTSHFTS